MTNEAYTYQYWHEYREGLIAQMNSPMVDMSFKTDGTGMSDNTKKRLPHQVVIYQKPMTAHKMACLIDEIDRVTNLLTFLKYQFETVDVDQYGEAIVEFQSLKL